MFAELLWVEPEQVVAGGNSSLTMMNDTLVDLLLHGGVDSPRPWSQEEKVTFICPVPGYDRHFTLLAVVRHRDGDRADARRRPRRRAAVAALRHGRPEHQGHVDRADLRQPVRARSSRRRSPPARLDADRGAGLQDLLGQRLRASTTSPRTRPRAPTSSASPRPPGTRTGRSCSPRRPRSPRPAPASRSSPPSVETREVVPRPPRQGLDRPRQGQPAAARAVLRLRAGRARPHGQAPRDHRAEVRRGRARPHRSASTAWASPPGPARPVATSSASTSSTAPPRAWSRPWPRRPASR